MARDRAIECQNSIQVLLEKGERCIWTFIPNLATRPVTVEINKAVEKVYAIPDMNAFP